MRANPDGTKWCSKCKTMLTVGDFGPSKGQRDGLQNWCRPCKRASMRLPYDHPQKVKQRAIWQSLPHDHPRKVKSRADSLKKYYADTKTHRTRARRAKLKREFGITPDRWDALFAEQGERCAVCKTDDFGGKRPHTDHCHKTGEVRGLLCKRCNQGVGFFVDDPNLMRAAADYIERSRSKP